MKRKAKKAVESKFSETEQTGRSCSMKVKKVKKDQLNGRKFKIVH